MLPTPDFKQASMNKSNSPSKKGGRIGALAMRSQIFDHVVRMEYV